MGALHKVLVIEDDTDDRNSFVEWLTMEGAEALGSADGAEAMGCLRKGFRPCVILLDLMMPGMDGWQFMERLRVSPAYLRIPIVVVSAYGTPQGVRALGAADYLKKPVAPDALFDTIERHCAKAS